MGPISSARDTLGTSTDEYQRMIARLGWPRDLFREGRPQAPGFTWDGTQNRNMIPKDDFDRQRLDYIFAFDQIPPVHDDEVCPTIRKTTLQDVAVLPFETAKPNHCLSDHFAVSATVAF